MEKWKSIMVFMVVLFVGITTVDGAVTVVTFDDIPGNALAIPDGYGGLNWDTFNALNVNNFPVSGFYNGVVSGDWVAYNAFAEMATVSNSPFTFKGAYFTAAWNDGLNINVKGYNAGCLVQETSFTVDTDGPTWVDFDWAGVDSLTFDSFSGVPNPLYTGINTRSIFAMDNFTYDTTVIPAPGAVVLGAIGCGCFGWLRRRKSL